MLKHWLKSEPFTLSLSSGFFGFFAHCGLWQAFHEEGIRPNKITGASAGALVGAAMATGRAPEEFTDIIFGLERKDFWDPRPGLGFLKGHKFRDLLRNILPNRFEDLEIPFESVVYAAHRLETQSINSGDLLPEMVVASCTVPILFHPVRVGRKFYWDGGYKDKMALTSVHQDERVFSHYLLGKDQVWGEAKQDVYADADKISEKVVFAVRGLPRVSPFALERGHAAFYRAYSSVKSVLNREDSKLPELLVGQESLLKFSQEKGLPQVEESRLNKAQSLS